MGVEEVLFAVAMALGIFAGLYTVRALWGTNEGLDLRSIYRITITDEADQGYYGVYLNDRRSADKAAENLMNDWSIPGIYRIKYTRVVVDDQGRETDEELDIYERLFGDTK